MTMLALRRRIYKEEVLVPCQLPVWPAAPDFTSRNTTYTTHCPQIFLLTTRWSTRRKNKWTRDIYSDNHIDDKVEAIEINSLSSGGPRVLLQEDAEGEGERADCEAYEVGSITNIYYSRQNQFFLTFIISFFRLICHMNTIAPYPAKTR